MSDIVEQLRWKYKTSDFYRDPQGFEFLRKAADEIERLRTAVYRNADTKEAWFTGAEMAIEAMRAALEAARNG